jgi:DNA-binding transcriptional LysR family regulator
MQARTAISLSEFKTPMPDLAKRGQKLQRTTMVLGSTEVIKRAVAAGLGVAIVSHLTI